MTKTEIATIATSTAAGGIPEDVQRMIVQVAVGVSTWVLVKAFEWLKTRINAAPKKSPPEAHKENQK